MTSAPSGYRIGHWTDAVGRTGYRHPAAGRLTAAVDVGRRAGNSRDRCLHAGQSRLGDPRLVFAGGSAFGLASAGGVMTWLKRRGVGFAIGPARVPIVAGAILFDLAVGSAVAYPDEAAGEAACEAAREGEIQTGAIGAGTGATVGKILGIAHAARGGIGAAAVVLPGGERVAALAAANPFGDIVDPDTGSRLAGPEARDGRFLTARALVGDTLLDSPLAAANSTLVCVATDVACDQASRSGS
jgi:L-aminopeptidase/D-esterase-like protein